MSDGKTSSLKTGLKWVIKRKSDGRYLQFGDEYTDAMIMFRRNKALASVFEHTRDYVDGLCMGLNYSIGEAFEPESISAHIQMPADAKVDDNNAGI